MVQKKRKVGCIVVESGQSLAECLKMQQVLLCMVQVLNII